MPSQIFSVRPLTPEEVDTLATVSTMTFILGALAFLCVLIAACIVAVKTKLPGRYGILLSLALLASWWAFERAMGANLEMTFGPEAILVSFVVYGAISVAFALCYLRLCMAVLSQQAAKVPIG